MRWIQPDFCDEVRELLGRDCFLLLQKGAGGRMKLPHNARRTSATLGLIPSSRLSSISMNRLMVI